MHCLLCFPNSEPGSPNLKAGAQTEPDGVLHNQTDYDTHAEFYVCREPNDEHEWGGAFCCRSFFSLDNLSCQNSVTSWQPSHVGDCSQVCLSFTTFFGSIWFCVCYCPYLCVTMWSIIPQWYIYICYTSCTLFNTILGSVYLYTSQAVVKAGVKVW